MEKWQYLHILYRVNISPSVGNHKRISFLYVLISKGQAWLNMSRKCAHLIRDFSGIKFSEYLHQVWLIRHKLHLKSYLCTDFAM